MVDVVVDVGNTRIKWGRCQQGRVQVLASLPPDAPEAWKEQLQGWGLPVGSRWCLTGVHPERRDRLAEWLRLRGDRVTVLRTAAELPLRVALAHPDRVGIDRLLDAVAVNSRRTPGVPAVMVDAGSAVTVDLVDGTGVFRGGAIFPGLRLMAEALRAYTALLPLIEVREPAAALGTSTPQAMHAGIFAAVAGGIERLIAEHEQTLGCLVEVFFTGGDGEVLAGSFRRPVVLWPEMTLEGVRLSALARHNGD